VFAKWEDMSKKVKIALAILAPGLVALVVGAKLLQKNWGAIWPGMQKVTETVVNKMLDAFNMVMRKMGEFILRTKELLDAFPGANPFGESMAQAAQSLKDTSFQIDLTTRSTEFMVHGMDVAGEAAKRLTAVQEEAAEQAQVAVTSMANHFGDTWKEMTAIVQQQLDDRKLMNDNAIANSISANQTHADKLNAIEQQAADIRADIAARSLNDLFALADAHNQRLRNAALIAASGVTGFEHAGDVPVFIHPSASPPLPNPTQTTIVGGEPVHIQPGLTPPGPNSPIVLQNRIVVELDGQALDTKIVTTVVNTAEGGGFEGVSFGEG